ncbi:hypothetical protein RyT2_07610 [Pseudolactococcus yaeyamensis]
MEKRINENNEKILYVLGKVSQMLNELLDKEADRCNVRRDGFYITSDPELSKLIKRYFDILYTSDRKLKKLQKDLIYSLKIDEM